MMKFNTAVVRCFSAMIGVLLLLSIDGCVWLKVRYSDTVSVADTGSRITTRNKYRLFADVGTLGLNGGNMLSVGGTGGWFPTHENAHGFHEKDVRESLLTSLFKRYQPDVFSDDGIPVILKLEVASVGPIRKYSWSALPHICTLGLAPSLLSEQSVFRFTVEAAESKYREKSHVAPFNIVHRYDESWTMYWPLSVAFFTGGPENSQKCYSDSDISLGLGKNEASLNINTDLFERALAYGVASRLKHLEESGGFDTGSALPFNVERLVCRDGKYAEFVLRPKAPFGGKDEQMLQIAKSFGEVLKRNPNFPKETRMERTIVAFREFKYSDGLLTGNAELIAVTILSLEYVDVSRKGILKMRVQDQACPTVKSWLRKNLQNLANDRNIILKAGNAPPPGGRYAIETEEFADGVLTIVFTTE